MKTCSLYGFISALAGAFVTLILYFLGFHSDISKLTAASWIGGLLGLAVTVVCLVLGVRARRDETPKDAEFGYGKAMWAGTLITFVASILSSVFTWTYYAFLTSSRSKRLKPLWPGFPSDRAACAAGSSDGFAVRQPG